MGEQVRSAYQQKEKLFGKEDLEQLERFIILQIIDNQWVAHLQDMEHMKEGIGLRGYGQLDPLKEYQKEGFALFGELILTLFAAIAKGIKIIFSHNNRFCQYKLVWSTIEVKYRKYSKF